LNLTIKYHSQTINYHSQKEQVPLREQVSKKLSDGWWIVQQHLSVGNKRHNVKSSFPIVKLLRRQERY